MYCKVTLDGVTHELNPANLKLLRNQISDQATNLSVIEIMALKNALGISGGQLMSFITGLK